MADTVEVPVISGWSSLLSKSNLTFYVGTLSSLLTLFGGPHAGLTANEQASIITTIQLVQGGVVWAMHRWFTDSVHEASL